MIVKILYPKAKSSRLYPFAWCDYLLNKCQVENRVEKNFRNVESTKVEIGGSQKKWVYCVLLEILDILHVIYFRVNFYASKFEGN